MKTWPEFRRANLLSTLRWSLTLTCWLILLAAPATAQTPVVLTDDHSVIALGPHLEILEDPAGAWTLADVTSPDLAGRFQPSLQDTPSFGFTDSVYWVRFRVENRSPTTSWRLALHLSHMNHIALYRPVPDGDGDSDGYSVQKTGNVLPFSTRDVPYHHFQFRLPSLATPFEERTFYLRFENEGAMILPLKLWPAHALEPRNRLRLLGLGLFYGIMLALIVYNLLLFVSLREESYLYHVLYVAMAMLCILSYDGLVQQYLWPRDSPWDPRAVIFFLLAAIAAALQFTSALLRTWTLLPAAHRILRPTALLATAMTPLSLVLPYRTLAAPSILLQLLSYCFIFGVSWVAWRRGYRPARFFFAAWLLFALGIPVLLTLTRVFPVLPAHWFNIGLRVGMDSFVLLFSLALADRIHIIRKEREEAQAELLNEQREALAVRDQMNAALHSSKSELRARNAELERYAYTVSHDLKSPVVTINGFLGLLEKDLAAGQTDRLPHHLERLRTAADKMGRLLDELLEMSRVGRVMGKPEAIALSDLASEAVELVAGSIEEQGVEVDVAPQMPTVSGDRTRLLEVFQNLIENAVKFTREQPSPRIEIRAWPDGDEAHCSVRDNGIGIEPAYHETVFGLFDQLDPSAGGTGIGLALVRRIVEVHGGKIWVESDGPGQGAAFRFTLPRHQ